MRCGACVCVCGVCVFVCGVCVVCGVCGVCVSVFVVCVVCVCGVCVWCVCVSVGADAQRACVLYVHNHTFVYFCMYLFTVCERVCLSIY